MEIPDDEDRITRIKEMKELSDVDKQYNDAIRLLIRATGDLIIVCRGEDDTVCLIADCEDEPCFYGYQIVEYQLSDGLPGERSHCNSFASLTEALKAFKEIEAVGWSKWLKRPSKEQT